jgi:signal transduction histidine kinase/DNA-binding LacI/PurR family transcriptional regulator/CheY-like chemotaxis protein
MARGGARIAFIGDTLLSRYQLRVLGGVQRAAHARGAHVTSFQLGTSVRDDDGAFDSSFMLDLPSEAAFDGLIVATNILSGVLPRAMLQRKFSSWGRPLVSLGELPGRPSVVLDSERGLSELVEHLATVHHCRRFAFIEGTRGNPDAIDREQIVRATLTRLGLALPSERVMPGNFLEPSGARAIRTLFDERGVAPSDVDAVIACNDEMAVGAMRELAAKGLRVPEDIAVVGFDDDQRGRNSRIPLTTVHQPVERLGTLACESLLRLIAGESVESPSVVVATTTYRRSCGCELGRERAGGSTVRKSLEDILASEELKCCSRLVREGAPPLAGAWIRPLFSKLREQCRDDHPPISLDELASITADACQRGVDVAGWPTELACLAEALGDAPRGERRERCRALLSEARSIVGLTTARAYSIRNLDSLQQANAVRVIGEALVCARSVASWSRTLQATLPALGVAYYCACLFSDDSRNGVKVIAQHRALEPGPLELPHDVADIWRNLPASLPPSQAPPAVAFSTTHFLPPNEPKPSSDLLVYPLLFAERALGYVAFGLLGDTSLAWMLEHLAAHMSCGLFTLARTSELSDARAQAETANRAKTEFLAVMSHEIRTPLTAVCGNIDLCLASELSTPQRDRLTRARDAAQGLRELVSDILDFSKIEATRIELENVPFDLDALLGQVISNHGLDARKKRLELVVDCDADLPLEIVGDPLRLSQILSNLLSNAIKFTDEGEIVLRVRQLARDQRAACLEFSVSDTGIGMDAAEVARIFKPFTQADASITRRYGGSGLGLSICASLAALMQSNIEVTSTPGTGSRFCFALQCAASGSRPRATLGGRALVVTPSAAQRAALNRALGAYGVTATFVRSGSAALAVATADTYSMALIDRDLSDSDAAGLAQELASRLGPSCLTALLGVAEPASAENVALGGEEILQVPKPWTWQDLANAFARRRPKGPLDSTRQGARRVPLLGKSLLVVQDDSVTAQWLREVLELAGARVEAADTGAKAVRLAADRNFDAVLMDLRLPTLSGAEASRVIRRHPTHGRLPILGLTASASAAELATARAAGIHECLITPIDAAQLVAKLEHLVNPSGSTAAEPSLVPRRPASVSTLLRAVRFPLDTQKALARVDGNQAIYRRLLARFLDAHAGSASTIRDALERGDVASALRCCHPLASASANVGALHLHRLALGLEAALNEAGGVPAADLGEFLEAHAAALAAAKSTLEAMPAAETGPADGGEQPLAQLLTQLAQRLEQHDAQSSACLKDLERLLPQTLRGGEPLRRLRRCVESYDFDAARLALTALQRLVMPPQPSVANNGPPARSSRET